MRSRERVLATSVRDWQTGTAQGEIDVAIYSSWAARPVSEQSKALQLSSAQRQRRIYISGAVPVCPCHCHRVIIVTQRQPPLRPFDQLFHRQNVAYNVLL